jgi:fatty-acyl-CoA synthase/long-chain acyl-CoA synthetase
MSDRHHPSAAELLRAAALERPDAEFIFDGTRRLTYMQVHRQAAALAASLTSQGVDKDSSAVIALPNWCEYVVAYIACQIIGMTAVPLISSIKKANFTAIVELVAPSTVFIASAEQEWMLEEAPWSGLVIAARHRSAKAVALDKLCSPAAAASSGAIADALDMAGGGDPVSIIFTSGSVGRPKGVILRASAMGRAASLLASCLDVREGDVFFTPVPFGHIFGLGPGLLLPLLAKGRLVTCQKFSVCEALELMDAEGVSVHFGVPTMFVRELKAMQDMDFAPKALRTGIIAGSPSPEGFIEAFERHTGCRLLNSYGMSETASALCSASIGDPAQTRHSSVGRPLPGVQIKLAAMTPPAFAGDALQAPAGPCGCGEILCKTPSMMAGYYKDDDATKEAFDSEGWFHTGDMGELGADGALRVVGRAKNIINRGGFKIHPEEVEGTFAAHPKLAECCAMPYPDPELGERVCLAVQLASGAWACDAELRGWASERLEKFKVPDTILFVDKMPKLNTGKTDRLALRQMLSSANRQ